MKFSGRMSKLVLHELKLSGIILATTYLLIAQTRLEGKLLEIQEILNVLARIFLFWRTSTTDWDLFIWSFLFSLNNPSDLKKLRLDQDFKATFLMIE